MEVSKMKTKFISSLAMGSNKIYTVNEAEDVFREIGYIKPFKDRKRIEWYNLPISFDIEVSSFYDKQEEKRACMYVWTVSFCGCIIMGRKWEEFVQLIERMVDFYQLSSYKRMAIYVHNLAYEFQFIRKLFSWDTIFALSMRKPIYALTDQGIEFRCSYLLSGYSLANLAKNTHCVKIEKLVGDLDYSKIRTWLTKLTSKEIEYCINDVQIVVAYILDLFEQGYDISTLPKLKQGLSVIIPGNTVSTAEKRGKIARFI